MKKRLMALCLALGLAAGLASCTGKKGDTGSQGPAGIDKGSLTGTVSDALYGSGITGATVSANGYGYQATTDGSGTFTIADLPIGVYTFAATAPGYNAAQSSTIGIVAGQKASVNFALSSSAVPPANAPPVLSLASQYQVGYGTTVTLNAVASDPNGDPITYTWSQTGGPSVALTSSGSSTSLTTKSFAAMVPTDDRFGVLGISPTTQGSYSVQVTASDNKGGKTTVSATITSAETSAGIANVPVGIALYLNAGTTVAPFNWTCTPPGGGSCSAAEFSGADTRNPRLLADGAGDYTITQGSNAVTIYAGVWLGVMNFTGLSAQCTNCHRAGGSAPDKFTPWLLTGHSSMLTRGMNGILSSHYGPSCLPCHTVGYDLAANNGGFDDLAAAAGWSFPSKLTSGNWASFSANDPAVAQLGNIQCENCHGPQMQNATFSTDAHMSSQQSTFVGPRVSFSAAVCAQCHDSPPHHANYQQWYGSAHANETLAREEATWEGRGTFVGHCGRCHSGQGFVQYLSQLEAGNPGMMSINAASAAQIGLTDAEVQPQTCAACHDPHDATNLHQVRVYDSTPTLAGGFSVAGMGAGAVCQVCHNSRNGSTPTKGSWKNCSSAATFLHEDGDPCGDNVLGPATAFSAPHVAAQADVFNGRNAYFVGAATQTAYLSKHANVANSCAGCHMELNPDGMHAFRIDPAKRAQVCANCHGSTSGDGLAAQVDGMLDALTTKVQNRLLSVINAAASPGAATYYLIANDYNGTDCNSNGASSGATSNVAIDQQATSVGLFEIHGSQGVALTFANPIAISNVNNGCFPYATTTVLYAQLGSLVTPTSASTTYVVPLTDPVVKAYWNRDLIEADSSEGIHNPSFVLTVLSKSLQALP